MIEWIKAALLEVQEYVRMLGQFGRGVTSRPFYYSDVIQQFDATTIVEPGATATVDEIGNLRIQVGQAP